MNYSILETIGNTPVVRLREIEIENNIKSKLYAKLEHFNPFGSIKDRAALQIIQDAEAQSLIKSNTIIEATSGNMGIALSAIARIKGYKCKIVMPENISESKKKLLQIYGAEIILTDSDEGMIGSLNKVKEILKKSDAYYCNQFNNYSSIKAHYSTTAPEIDRKLNEKIDVIISGIGSGGTISGIGTYFKEKYNHIKIVGVEPNSYPHKIQGIGAGFIPSILKLDIIDEIVKISYEEAYEARERLIKVSSIFAGISSGAVLSAAIKLSNQIEYQEKNIVMIFADSGERYI